MYADHLLLISSTCSDVRRMLRTVFSKPTVYNTVTFNTVVFLIPVYRAPLSEIFSEVKAYVHRKFSAFATSWSAIPPNSC